MFYNVLFSLPDLTAAMRSVQKHQERQSLAALRYPTVLFTSVKTMLKIEDLNKLLDLLNKRLSCRH